MFFRSDLKEKPCQSATPRLESLRLRRASSLIEQSKRALRVLPTAYRSRTLPDNPGAPSPRICLSPAVVSSQTIHVSNCQIEYHRHVINNALSLLQQLLTSHLISPSVDAVDSVHVDSDKESSTPWPGGSRPMESQYSCSFAS